MKRSASPLSPRLMSRTSTLNASVTLFKLEEPDAGPLEDSPILRRSKRVKLSADDEVLLKAETKEVLIEERGKKKARTTGKAKEKRVVSPRKPKAIPQSLEKPHPAPIHWREAYDAIKEIRAKIVAPVDTMGCDRAQHKEQDPKNQRYATLVSLMLSSQTKDEVTDAAVSKLREAVGGSLNVDALLATDESAISEAINKVGFWRRKTQYLKQATQRLHDEFDSDVPKTVDELCSLPGVGPKMAFLALQVAWNLNHGIGVDVHVHRITNRLKWHKPPTKNPEETRLNLQSWLPKELHGEINHLLVGFGQTICLPVGPRCDQCTLSASGLCPSAQKVTKSRSKKTVVATSSSGPKLEIAIEESTTLNTPIKTDRNSSPLSPLSDVANDS